MEKILVTGAAGYLGSTICTQLLQKGYKVTGVDNLFFKKDTLFHLKKNKNFEFFNLDVRETQLYKDLISKD